MGDDQRPRVQRNQPLQGYGLYLSAREIQLVGEVVYFRADGAAAASP